MEILPTSYFQMSVRLLPGSHYQNHTNRRKAVQKMYKYIAGVITGIGLAWVIAPKQEDLTDLWQEMSA